MANFSSQSYFSEAKISYESKRVLFDQMKVSERRTEPKTLKLVTSTINKKPRQFHLIKSNKEVTLKTLESYFLYRKQQKLKIAKNVLRKLFSKNLLKIFSFLGNSRSAEKKRSGQLSQK